MRMNRARPTRVSGREQVLVTRQLATLLAAGLPLMESLQVLEKQAGSRALQRVLQDVVSHVAAGGSLAEALKRHPATFPPLYTGMVAAGEFSGTLDTVLLRLASLIERTDALSRKIKGAMLYPIVVLGVALASIFLLLVLVIPTFEVMFAQAEIPLPLPTQWVLGLSRGLAAWGWAVLAFCVLGGVLWRQYVRTPAGVVAWHRCLLHLPVLGPIQRKAGSARFARILGTMLAAGVSLVDGLDLAARTSGNRVLENAILASRHSVVQGVTLAHALHETEELPPLVIQMIQVGEQTGALDDMLSRMADLFEDEVAISVESFVSLLEPTLVLFLGLAVGGMVIAMYLPIFDMVSMVG